MPYLYIVFFEIGIKYLNKNGILGYITTNSFIRSLNAKNLRAYFKNNEFSLSIIDFGSNQIFDSKITYTCLCFIKIFKSKFLKYSKIDPSELSNQDKIKFNRILYENLDDNKWISGNKMT